MVIATTAASGFMLGFRPAPSHATSGGKGEFAAGTGGTAKSPIVAAPGIGPAGPRAAWVVTENARPGTGAWRITDPGKPGDIEGYADSVSVERGELVTLFVSTKASRFHVEGYRMGYYGGKGARLVWQSPPIDGTLQGKPTRTSVTNMVEARWQPTLRVPVTAAWPQGVYLLKLVADTGAQQYVPLTVRDDTSTAAYVVQSSVTTWQAYNLWGGYDLYSGRNGNVEDFDHRSRVVSFDRPYELGSGSGDFLGNEFPLVSLVESIGLDVTYSTDVDLHERGFLLSRHKTLLSLGHDEYWSTAMRLATEAARDAGVNVAFFGANAVFRHIRLEPSDIGPDRHEVAYKSARADPEDGVDDREVTVNWRDPPVSQPESTLIGEEYECNPVHADMVVADSTSWVYAGTGLHDGDRLPGVIGTEYDRYSPHQRGPDNVELLAHSPVRCHGQASYSDMTYYTAPSGAGVFATGTNWWISKLSAGCPDGSCPHDDHVIRITQNVLAVFGGGPAAGAHPSVANAAAVIAAAGPPGGAVDGEADSTATTFRRRRSSSTTSRRRPTKR